MFIINKLRSSLGDSISFSSLRLAPVKLADHTPIVIGMCVGI